MIVPLTIILVFFIKCSEAKVKKGKNNLYRIIKKNLKGIFSAENINSQIDMPFEHPLRIKIVN
jgi:hypothetical protein